jgi:flavin-dependent dehydrogenase
VSRSRVVVVGGGPAGIAAALFAVHSDPGLKDGLVVLERARYPREKYCAGALGGRADRLLGKIGVSIDVPSAPISGIAFRAMGRTSIVREPDAGRVVRRLEFDHALAKAAMDRGIDVREGVAVRGLAFGAHGVEVDTDAGPLTAEVVIGADGVRSVVRRALGLDSTGYVAQALEVDTDPVESDLSRDVILFDASHRELPGYYWDFPTIVDGEPKVCRGVYYLKEGCGSSPSLEIHDLLSAELEARGIDLRSLRQKRYAERGFRPQAPVSRPRVILAGESAGIDPVTGEGIAQAIQYGAVAGAYVGRKLSERTLGFEDWSREIRASSVGRDLVVRTAALGLFYGARRAEVERFLLDTPDFIRVGMQHFAGKPWSPGAVVRGGGAAFIAAMRAVSAALFSSRDQPSSVAPWL